MEMERTGTDLPVEPGNESRQLMHRVKDPSENLKKSNMIYTNPHVANGHVYMAQTMNPPDQDERALRTRLCSSTSLSLICKAEVKGFFQE